MSDQGPPRPLPVPRYRRRPYRRPEESIKIETPDENGPCEESSPNPGQNEVRLVLLGRTGTGKSASGNTILGEERFDSVLSMGSVTKKCKREHGTVEGRNLLLIDTPGLFDTDLTEEEVQCELIHCLTLYSPGPHAFLLVIPIERYTQEHQQTVQRIQEMFQHEISNHVIIVFSHADRLNGTSIDEFLSNQNPKVQELLEMFGKRYVAFNNNDPTNREQVSGLLKKVDELLLQHENKPFKNDMTEKVQKAKALVDERRKEKIKEDIKKEADQRRAAFTAHMKEDREDFQKIKNRVRVRIDQIEADIKKEKENVSPFTKRLMRMQASLNMEQMNLRRLERDVRERKKREPIEMMNIDEWMCEEQKKREEESQEPENYSVYTIMIINLSLVMLGIGIGSFGPALLSFLFPAASVVTEAAMATQILAQMLNLFKDGALIMSPALKTATLTRCSIQ